MADTYFDDVMVNRQRLIWTVATRRQLERWEPLVASVVRMDALVPDCAHVWSAAIEHHFALVAARNVFQALDLIPASRVSVDPTLRFELIEGRDLHEHWPENMPVFNVTPRVAEPQYPSGKRFAKRIRISARAGGSTGVPGRALASCRTSLLRRCMSCSMQSRPRSSATIPGSASVCRHAHRRRGFTTRASGGPSRSPPRSCPISGRSSSPGTRPMSCLPGDARHVRCGSSSCDTPARWPRRVPTAQRDVSSPTLSADQPKRGLKSSKQVSQIHCSTVGAFAILPDPPGG